ncbi:MAG: UDP-N-acetylmuramoyl-L-alanyl-D-glutamate--2,6-diaminopimelate ligase [Clostridia bacterium]
MKFEQIYNLLNKENLIIDTKKCFDDINYISYNSKDIEKNTLFFCKGTHYKKEYLDEAINLGAVMYIAEENYNLGNIPYIIVKDIRIAMAVISINFYNNSHKNLTTIGITGTKGKTTVTYFLNSILNKYTGSKNAYLSTSYTYTGVREEKSHLTTPEALELNKYMKEAVDSNIKYLTMEVASQGYKKSRVYGLTFNYGIFLNISEDHISEEEHRDFNDYLNCKIEIMKLMDNAIINSDTDYYELVKSNCKNITTYGSHDADYIYKDIIKLDKGFKFTVVGKNYSNEFSIDMEGRFNVENALAAIVVAKLIGVSDDIIQQGLKNINIVGRMEIYEKNGITAVIDYAHNLISYTKLYESIKLDYTNRRIISIGGCVGSKAFNRRKDFGTVVGKYSDYVYLTSDDPGYEDINSICKDITSYMTCDYEIIEDRYEAIKKAFLNAKSGDVIVIVGKGEEEYQKICGKCVPCSSDIALTKKILLGE